MTAIALTPPAATLDDACALADKLATNERRTAYVVMDQGHPLLACPDDMGMYWNVNQIVYRADPPVDIPNQYPDPSPGDEPPVYPEPNGRAPSLYALLVAECQAELDACIRRAA